MTELSDFEIKFFTDRLSKVTRVLGNLELIKLYGRKKVLDLGKLETKSTKSNSAPDIVDLQAIDLDMELRALLFAFCREYEESVMVNTTDMQGLVTGQAALPPIESSDPAVMVEYLSDPVSLEWMRFQQGFEESAVEIIELIEKAIRYTTATKIEKPSAFIGIEAMRDKFIGHVEDYPRTPIQIVRLVNGAGYPLQLKVMMKWIENGTLHPVGMVGKKQAYKPSDAMDRYAKYLQRAAQVSFVNRVA